MSVKAKHCYLQYISKPLRQCLLSQRGWAVPVPDHAAQQTWCRQHHVSACLPSQSGSYYPWQQSPHEHSSPCSTRDMHFTQ